MPHRAHEPPDQLSTAQRAGEAPPQLQDLQKATAMAMTLPAASPPLGRTTSRMPDLSHIQAIEAHPPAHQGHHHQHHHAHFDETEALETSTPPALHSPPRRRRKRAGGAGVGSGGGGDHGKPVIDIEHVPVDDDPRDWSNTKKNIVLMMLTISVVRPRVIAATLSGADIDSSDR